ncbi:MAG: hypothetical protein GY742_20335 [Hyphomicrobiales bacterium]|nr:hypothetical protein [Hyphomicrobiales bacterium]
MKTIERTFWIFPVMLVLASIVIFPSNSFAGKNKFLNGLSGNWKGKGFVITSVGAKEEAIRCRLNNRSDTRIAKLNLSGNCGIGGVLIPMVGWIKQSGNSRKYVASLFRSLAFLRIDSFTGRLSGKKLKLSFKGRDKVNKEKISAFVTIYYRSKNRFDLLLSSTDFNTKKQYKVGTIEFSRK